MKFQPRSWSKKDVTKWYVKTKANASIQIMQFRREELGGGGVKEEYSWWWVRTVSVVVLTRSAFRSSPGDALHHQEPLIRSSPSTLLHRPLMMIYIIPLFGLFSFLHDNYLITYTWSIWLHFLIFFGMKAFFW